MDFKWNLTDLKFNKWKNTSEIILIIKKKNQITVCLPQVYVNVLYT